MSTKRLEAEEGATPAPGTILGKYLLLREIGRGGMCQVFEARHTGLDGRVAVKTLLPQYATQPAVVERFLREGKAATRVQHPHAIRMVDVGEAGRVVYLAMEFLDGEDLAKRIKRCGALPPAEAIDLLLPVLSALAEAHHVGVVHRDMKPANVFLAVDRRGVVTPKVLDFGISKVEGDQGQTGTEVVMGTPSYMAPEQVRSAKESCAASDQYALGVMVYQCVTGAVPFRGENTYQTFQLIEAGRYTPPRALVPTLPEGLEAAIMRAMSVRAESRFPSVLALGEALLPYASDGARARWTSSFGAPAEGLSSPPFEQAPRTYEGTITQASVERVASPPTERPARRHAAWVAFGAVAVLVIAAAAGRLTRPTERAAPTRTPPRAARALPPPTPGVVAAPTEAAPTAPPPPPEPAPPPALARTLPAPHESAGRPARPHRGRPREPTAPTARASPDGTRDPHGVIVVR